MDELASNMIKSGGQISIVIRFKSRFDGY